MANVKDQQLKASKKITGDSGFFYQALTPPTLKAYDMGKKSEYKSGTVRPKALTNKPAKNAKAAKGKAAKSSVLAKAKAKGY